MKKQAVVVDDLQLPEDSDLQTVPHAATREPQLLET
jgi:hypothetical protein